MRATQGTTYRTMQAQINQLALRLQEMRTIAVTGKKVSKTSDDPTAVRPILNARSSIRVNDRYLKSMGTALDRTQAMDSQFNNIENIMVRAKEISINSINGSLTAEDRNTLAQEIGQLKAELLGTANTKIDGKYVFAGFMETTIPFTANPAYDAQLYDPANSSTWPVTYNGDANPFKLEIAPGETVEATVAGSAVFLGDAAYDGKLLTITLGTNDSIDFQEDLAGLSGQLTATLTPGTYTYKSLAAEIETQMEAGTVNAVDYTVTYDSMTNKFVINDDGTLDELQLLWSSGTNAAAGAASTIGYATNADDLGANTYTADNAPANSDGIDLFAVLTRIEAALLADSPTRVNAELSALDQGADQARRYRGQIGTTARRIETSMGHMEEVQIDVRQILSRYEDADILEAFTNMTQQETALEAALNITGRISKLSIFNYL